MPKEDMALGTLAKNDEGIRGIHALMTPEEALAKVRADMKAGDSGPGVAMRAARLNINSPQVQALLQKQNTHATQYANDPAYRKKWHSERGDMWRDGGAGGSLNPFKTAFNVFTLANLGGGLGKEIGGAMGGGGTAAGSGAPVGGMAGSTPGMSATGAGTGVGLDAFGGAGGPVSTPTSFSSPGSFGGTTGAGSLNSLGDNPSSSGGFNWDNALIAGSSLASGLLSHDATEKGIDEIGRQYDQTRADFAPWRQAGVNALGKMENFDIDTIRNDPMYQLQNTEALRAINRGNSARGLNLSGNALIDEARTAADISSNYGNNMWNRQAGLAGVGQAATASGAQMGQNSANNLSNLYLQQGQGYNNALQGGLSNYLDNRNFNQFMQNYGRS